GPSAAQPAAEAIQFGSAVPSSALGSATSVVCALYARLDGYCVPEDGGPAARVVRFVERSLPGKSDDARRFGRSIWRLPEEIGRFGECNRCTGVRASCKGGDPPETAAAGIF